MADDPAMKPKEQAKKGGEGSDDSPTEWAGPSEMSKPPDQKLNIRRRRRSRSRFLKMFDPELSDNARAEPEGPRKKGGEGSDDSPTEWAGPSEMFDPMWYDYKTAEPEGPRKFTEQGGGKGSDDSPAEWASPFEMSKPPDQKLNFRRRRRSRSRFLKMFDPELSDNARAEPEGPLKVYMHKF